ncbi:MAG: glycosyltransferase family 2 protein [Pseudonocardiaceae bacterium]
MEVPAPISVVIPAHNAEKFIQEAIASVRAQTLPVAEVIVVADDCSDDTRTLAGRLGAKVIEAKHRNISAAINQGVRTATQKWIALLDADDLWEADKIEAQWKAVQAFPDAAIISCDLYTQLNGRISKRSAKQLHERRSQIASPVIVGKQGTYFPQVDGAILTGFQVSPPTALIRRDVFDTAGFFDEQLLYNANVEFFARALKYFSLVVIEEPLVCQRIRNDSHSTNVEGAWAAYVSIVNRMLRHPDRYPSRAGEKYRESLKHAFLPYERILAERRRNGYSQRSVAE